MYFIRLPQLAVLAKILCLLMVVMCGAVPSTVPSVSLYSTCSRGYVTVYGRTVKSTGRNEHNAPYQKLTTQSTDFSRKLYIFAEKSKRYICFNKRWKIITLPEKRRNEYCQFNETYNGRYLRYHSVVDPTRYIGFSRAGRAIAWPRGRPDCYNFLKLNPNAGVERHNSLITSAKGGGLKHPPQPPQRPGAGDRDNRDSRDRGGDKLGPFGGALLGAPPRGNALRTMSNALGKINLNLVNTGPSGGSSSGDGGGGGGGSSKNALVSSGSSSSLGSKSLTLSSLSSSFSSSSSSPPSQQSSTSLMISSSSSASSSGSGSAGNINVNRNNNNNNRKLRQQQKQLTTSPGGQLQQQQRRPHRHRHGKSWDQAGTSRRRHHGRLHQPQQQQQQQQQPSSSTH